MVDTAQHSLRGYGRSPQDKVEEIGANMGMSEVGACERFLALQGSLWDVYNGSLALA
jgi:hypothetical protein